MTFTRRGVISGIGASTLLAACGNDSATGSPSVPPPGTAPAPVPTPPPVRNGPVSILTLGMSVFQGADLVGTNYPDYERIIRANAPVRYFADRLQTLFDQQRGGAVTEHNAAVGGSFDNDTPKQYETAPKRSYDLVFLGLAMNSGSAYGVHGRGPNADFTRGILRDLLARIKADGAQPIVCNTIHPWPEKITPESITGALQEGIAWPAQSATLYQHVALSFDEGAGDIICQDSAFTDGPGRFLTTGSQLRILSGGGLNEGRICRVAQRLAPGRLRIQPGDIAQSGDFYVFAQHYAPDPEGILDPPPSRQRQSRDWNGTGRVVEGIASYHLWNDMLRELCAETDTLLFDLEYRGFEWAAKYGWESIYVSNNAGQRFETFNHPQIQAQSVIYGGLMRQAADMFHQNTLPKGYAVLRGPGI